MIEKPTVLTIDLETKNLSVQDNEIILIAYSVNGGPVKQLEHIWEGDGEFQKLLADPTVVKRGHNCRYDLLCLSNAGFVINGPIDDTRILAYLEDPNQELDLKGLVERKLKRQVVRMEDFGVKKEPKHSKAYLKKYPLHTHIRREIIDCGGLYVAKRTLKSYNESDVINCNDLRKELVETPWYTQVEQPLAQILFKAEERGIQLDIPYLKELKNEFENRLQEYQKALPQDFNPASPKQVKEKFKEQGINLDSTDKHTLKQLAWNGNGFAGQLLKYRGLSKLLSTYVEPLMAHSDSSGRIHGRFNQAGRESTTYGDIKGTATGRLSSSDPNLQNIPKRTTEGSKIIRGFTATPGLVLVESDLSQIEPRLIAHFSQSKVLLNAYERGLDTHAIMGGLIFNKSPEQLSKLERFIGKTSWLATVYGCWYKKLRLIAEINSDEKLPYDDSFYERVQSAFWAANPELREWRESFINESRARGTIETLGGRILKIPGLASKNQWEQQEAQRLCINYKIQGSAADTIKTILVELNKKWEGHILATVHDSVLGEIKNLEQKNILHKVMTNTVKLNNVPMKADTKVGPNWGELK